MQRETTCTCRTPHSWWQIIGLILGLDDGAHTKECDLIRFKYYQDNSNINNMQRENKWQDRFDKKFVVKSNAGTDLLRYTDANLIKQFIQSEIDTARAEERSRIAKWADDNTGAGGDTPFCELICCIANEENEDIAFKNYLTGN